MRATRALRIQFRHGPYTSAGATKSLKDELQNTIMPKKKEPLAGHSEVVDFELCTTAADLLEPSLQQYKGCNIIDVHPGAGLWSSTINNLLRPKRHVLIEDNERLFPFLDRLLQSDPSYTHVRYNGCNPQSLARVVDEGIIPQPEFSSDPSKPSTSTLILMNLTRIAASRPGMSRIKDRFRKREASLNFFRDAWLQTGIQKHGPVRALVWVDDYVKDNLVPRTVSDNNTSIISARYASHMHIVAEDFKNTARADGGSELEWASTWQAMKRMEAAGQVLPEKRQNPLYQTLLRLGDDWPRTWERIRQTKLKDFDKLDVLAGRKVYHRQRATNQPYLKEAQEVRRLELLAVDNSIPKEARVAAREEYKKRYEELRKVVVSMSEVQSIVFHQDMDRRVLMDRDPPGLAWDRRPFEPLNCTDKDFYLSMAPNGLALLDVCASRPTRQQSLNDMVYWERLVCKIMQAGMETVGSRFNKLSPGAAEQLLPKLSLLHDPLRHGSLHPEHFRARMMTYEMLDEMVAAWRSWPSRPSHIEEELSQSSGSWASAIDSKA